MPWTSKKGTSKLYQPNRRSSDQIPPTVGFSYAKYVGTIKPKTQNAVSSAKRATQHFEF